MSEVEIKMGDGRIGTSCFQAKVVVRIGDFSTRVTFYVTKLSDSMDVVLGEDWMKKHKAVLDYGDTSVTLKHGQRFFKLAQHSAATKGRVPVERAMCSAMQAKRASKKGCYLFHVQVQEDEEEVAFQVDQDMEWSPPPSDKDIPPALRSVVNRYGDVFPKELPSGLPPDRGVGHTIPLVEGAKPPFRGIYRLSPLELEEVKTQVTSLLAKGWIEPSKSPFGAPVLFVQKKDGSLRMCVDYRALNKLTVKNRYALPRIDDIFDKLQGAKWFTSLDLAQGYHQIRISEEDVPKTAFRTPIGHYQYKVLCFGLTNAPATFQSVMNDMFKGSEEFCCVYMDDILIFSKTEREHIWHVQRILEVLRQNKFYAKLSKCDFMKKQLLYLGHIISSEGIKPDPAKIAVVKDWPEPDNVHKLRSFLGFCNYFRKFIQGYSKLALPLTSLTKKGERYEWTDACQQAFEGLKWNLTNAPLLSLPDPGKPYEMVADASGYAIGGVLFQEGKPIAYESRKMNSAEQRYSAGEQELLAVVHCLRHWRCYLEGCTGGLTLVTDHKPNTFLSTTEMLSRRQARWSELLSRYDYQWLYRPGRLNCADPLSRIESHKPCQSFLSTTLCSMSCDLWAVTRSMARSGKQQEDVGKEDSGGTQTQIPTSEPSDLARSAPRYAHQHDRARAVDSSTSAVHGTAESSNTEYQATVLDVESLRRDILEGYSKDGIYPSVTGDGDGVTSAPKLVDGFWYKDARLCIPNVPAVKQAIISAMHDPPYRGHMGVAKTTQAVCREFYWPSLANDVLQYVRNCGVCQRDKPSNQKPAGLLQSLSIPGEPWESVSMDFITELPETSQGNNAILVFVDRLTKMTHLVATTTSVDAEDTADLFVATVVRLHGFPKDIVSDRDPRFAGKFFSSLCKDLQIRQSMSTAFHPESDGQTERMNRVVEEFLRHYVNHKCDNWEELLPWAEFSINNAQQESTKYTPFFLNYGRHPRHPLENSVISGMRKQAPSVGHRAQSNPEQSKGQATPSVGDYVANVQEHLRIAKANLQRAQDRQKSHANRKRRDDSFEVGHYVLLNAKNLQLKLPGVRKLWPRWLGPFLVTAKVGKVAYKLSLPQSMKCHPVFHVSLLKAYRTDGRVQPPPPPIEVDGELEYEVEQILDKRVVKRRGSSRVHYLVKWVGYGVAHNTWEPEENLVNCSKLVEAYEQGVSEARRIRETGKKPKVVNVS
jgi:hypothetical protein